ncbi:LPD7 domain-containing protein [Ralstonia pseudosolanacearum]|uniref:LPD7 domain-containing protein n=1 Tax=Ralstonia pseudosolanacearum TaxID=1310165 RepID=UPI0008D95042|nr:LPD7 domain-containing protein [Ralstonia pseudosolanacearum]MCL1622625.1 relaxase [Ralstonia pseudosolanacearum CaRs-Mep]
MLIRVRGNNDGVKEYLEKGQKHDREFGRDEMDERVILAGDLDVTDALIQTIATDAERYLHITLAFKEDELSREVLADITRDFEAFMFTAYRPDEYNFYAEAHVPRLKSYADRKSGELVERKVHIHIVVPSLNRLTGRRLDPFGKVEQQTRFLEAFQEHVNAKYGLASPRDNRRVAFTDASEMISRYKGDAFDGSNRELRSSILDALLARDITRYEDFRSLLTEFGEVRTRNAGRGSEYENVKPPGAAKGVNLKEYVFSREFVELSAEGKRAAMEARVHAEYVAPGQPRSTPAVFREALAEWHAVRAREVKYLNSGSPFYKVYREAPADEQRKLLAEREFQFYQPYGGLDGKAIGRGERSGYGERDAWRWAERDRGRGWGDSHPEHGREIEAEPGQRDWRGGHGRGGVDVDADRPIAAPESADRVRGLPFGGVDGHPARGEVLLPADPLLELGVGQAERTDALRRAGDLPGAGAGERSGVSLSAEDLAWRFVAARMYDAYQAGGPAERARMGAASATKFTQYQFAPPPGAAGTPAPFGQRPGPRNLADIQGFDAIGSMPFEPARSGVGVNAINSQPVGTDAPPHHFQPPQSWPPAGAGDIVVPFNGRARPSTGREADSVLDQLARDLSERRAAGSDIERAEFREIKANLDAQRLLDTLSRTHGLIVDKYAVTKGADGGDRIRAGTRNLNVSDFLTKELNLSWADAAQLLRTTYRAQTGQEIEAPSQQRPEPTPALWREFMLQRASFGQVDRAVWSAQLQSERERREAIRSAFRAARTAIGEDPKLSQAQVKSALSTARMKRVERETALSRAITSERDTLRASKPSQEDRYLAYLAARGQRGDHAALFELQRLRRQEPTEDPRRLTIRPARPVQPNAILYDGPVITHQVQRNGDVEYQRNGAALLVDQGKSVRLWQNDQGAIEIALRLAQQKFGPVLELTGPLEFQMEAARVAADARLSVEFADPAINRIFLERREMLQELQARQGRAPEQSAAQLGPSPDSADHAPDRTQTPNGVSERDLPRADPERGNEPER